MGENHGFTVSADKPINRLIRSRWTSSVVVGLFLSSVPWANADPVGDFFKKVGQSISKAFQPQPAQHQPKKTRGSRRPTSREPNIAQASPTPSEEASKPPKEEK